jgi:signal peptidase II
LKNSKWHIFFIIVIVGVFIDYFTKYLVLKYLRLGEPVNVIGQYAQFLLVLNKAAVWGFEPRKYISWFPLNNFFIVFNSIAMIVIIIYYVTIKNHEKLMQWGLSLVMAGAIGNMLDRILHPDLGVVDFIRLGISERIYWAIFNCADVYVTFGIIFMLLHFIKEEKKRNKKEESNTLENIKQQI